MSQIGRCLIIIVKTFVSEVGKILPIAPSIPFKLAMALSVKV